MYYNCSLPPSSSFHPPSLPASLSLYRIILAATSSKLDSILKSTLQWENDYYTIIIIIIINEYCVFNTTVLHKVMYDFYELISSSTHYAEGGGIL